MEGHKETIAKLKFIGKIQAGEKINVKFMFVQPVGIATSISRSLYYQDNRGNTLNFVRSTVKECFTIMDLYKSSEDPHDLLLYKHIATDLRESIKGLINLKTTYANDVMFGCEMDTLMEAITTNLSQNKEFNV